MQGIIIAIVSFLSGVTASLGLGGGFVLLIYLTAVANVDQMQAQGINLIFFLPIAALSLIFHARNKLLDTRPLVPAIVGGLIGVCVGYGVGRLLGGEWIAKLFALFLFAVGLKELLHRKKSVAESPQKGG